MQGLCRFGQNLTHPQIGSRIKAGVGLIGLDNACDSLLWLAVVQQQGPVSERLFHLIKLQLHTQR